MSLVHILQKTHLFSGIEKELLQELEPFTHHVVLNPGYNEALLVVSADDSSAPDLYLVLDGKLTLERDGSGAGLAMSAPVTSLEEELFGEISWLLKRPRISDVFTHSRAAMLRIEGGRFAEWLSNNPNCAAHIWHRIAEALAKRLVQTFAENQSHKEMLKLMQF
ncbi:MAG: cyclic nucleotide-binding domain-containing protein [Magnetococcales bacterium]|nr:cyclic nucleotide-binding domain-containing protein [Magnetococcales bacterium]MBF0114393.1 cyclic nucleotide-binding domain-containing protein [Magnetococcales bacterium]